MPQNRRFTRTPHIASAVGAALLTLATGAPVGFGQRAPERPNIVLLMSDDHSAQALGCYGSDMAETPGLDRLAAGGMRFDAAYVTESICKPSRAAFLTGKYGHVTGGAGWSVYNKQEHKSFPEYLRRAGYETALFGKWHLGEPVPGFQRYATLPGQGRYRDPKLIHKEGGARVHEGHISDVVTDLGIEWLEAHKSSDAPFLLCIQDKAAHMPWRPPRRLADRYAGRRMPEPPTLLFDRKHPDWPAARCTLHIDRLRHWMPDWPAPPADASLPERRRQLYQTYIKEYVRTIEGMDRNVRRLLDYLKANGLKRRTVVIYTSDQGFFLGERGLFDKRFMYEPSSRIPFIVRYPPIVEPGTQTDRLVSSVDLAPTLLDLAGIRVPEAMQGRSLRPLLKGQSPDDWRDGLYYRLYANNYRVIPHYGLRTERYKLIHFKGRGRWRGEKTRRHDTWQLFDLKRDPHETVNLYGQPAHQDRVARLKQQLAELRTRLGDPPE